MLTRTLVHIWVPFCLYTYGAMIALGAIATYYALLKDPKRSAIINQQELLDLFSWSTIIGVIGARLLYIISAYRTFTHWTESFCIHQGGLSIWGVIIALLLFLPYYLRKKHIPILPALDLAGIYGSLFQAIARIGCLFAGCCYGIETNVPWAICYTNPDTLAPLHCWLHPTQLYSSLSFLCLFTFLYALRSYTKFPGIIFCLYLFLSSLSRLTIDFLRDDREFVGTCRFFSLHQLIALGLMATAAILYIGIMYNKRSKEI